MSSVKKLIQSEVCMLVSVLWCSASFSMFRGQDASLQHFATVCASVSVRDKTTLLLFIQVSKPTQLGPRTSCLLASQRPDMSASGYVHITLCDASRKFNWTPSFYTRRSLLPKMWLQVGMASCVLLYNWPLTSLVLTVYNTTTTTKIWQVPKSPFIMSLEPGSCFILKPFISQNISWHPLCSVTW
jgi:hypothetical protein